MPKRSIDAKRNTLIKRLKEDPRYQGLHYESIKQFLQTREKLKQVFKEKGRLDLRSNTLRELKIGRLHDFYHKYLEYREKTKLHHPAVERELLGDYALQAIHFSKKEKRRNQPLTFAELIEGLKEETEEKHSKVTGRLALYLLGALEKPINRRIVNQILYEFQ